MQLPRFVWQIKGEETGPNVVVMGGTHGDELPGIQVVQSLLRLSGLLNTPSGTIAEKAWVKGNLFLALGNPEAILRNTRGASGKRDLNRSFILPELFEEGVELSMDQERAKELVPLLSQTDLLLDLHATSNPSEPFLCTSRATDKHMELARLFPVRYMVTDPKNILGQDMNLPVTGTTDYCVNTMGSNGQGGVAICYESGKSDDVKQVAVMQQTVVKVLRQFGSVTPGSPLTQDENVTKEYQVTPYQLVLSIVATESGFSYAVKEMEKGWQLVEKNTLVGNFPSGQEVRVPVTGMYLFPRRADLVKAGETLFYIAQLL